VLFWLMTLVFTGWAALLAIGGNVSLIGNIAPLYLGYAVVLYLLQGGYLYAFGSGAGEEELAAAD
jgi:hypothetical protein